MTTLKKLRVVIVSPSDVKEERKALVKVIENVNHNTATDLGLILIAGSWEKDSYPGFHVDGPQAIIDQTLNIENCDILIGIFWKRFGTPIKKMVKLEQNMKFIKHIMRGRKIKALILCYILIKRSTLLVN